MSRRAITALDLPFLVEPIDFLCLSDDVLAKQLDVGLAHMNVARAGEGSKSEAGSATPQFAIDLRKDHDIRRKLSAIAEHEAVLGEALQRYSALDFNFPIRDQVGGALVHP